MNGLQQKSLHRLSPDPLSSYLTQLRSTLHDPRLLAKLLVFKRRVLSSSGATRQVKILLIIFLIPKYKVSLRINIQTKEMKLLLISCQKQKKHSKIQKIIIYHLYQNIQSLCITKAGTGQWIRVCKNKKSHTRENSQFKKVPKLSNTYRYF